MTCLHFDNARLIDPDAGTDGPGSLTIDGGLIGARDMDPPKGARIIDAGGMCLAPGIIDIGVKIGEPGERHRESFRSAGLAAAAGGVTTIIARPDTTPIDTPEVLEFVTRRAAEARVRIRHMAALTKGRMGREMTEIGFLLDAGAIAFTDCDHVATDTKALSRALTYARSLGALVIGHPQEPGLSEGAAATSGKFASLRGLPSVHPMAERMALDRDLALVEMTGARYHADQITTARSLPALERAKANGLDVTAGISIHHLTLNDLDVGDYRTFFKLTPPLRSEEDRMAMVEAVASGLIDIIGSFHSPQDEESKRLPFEEAAAGAVGLQTLLPAAMRLYHAGAMDLPAVFRALSLNPARRLGLPQGRITPGAPADLVMFDPDAPFVLDRFTLHSKSKNTPLTASGWRAGCWPPMSPVRRSLARQVDDAGTDQCPRCARPGGDPCLSAGLGSLRRADHPGHGPGRSAPDRIGQYRGHECAAHRQQGGGGGDAAAGCGQGRGRGAGRARRGGAGCGAGGGALRLSGPSLSGLAGVSGRQGVATFLGTLLALAWPVGLAACAAWAAGAAVTRISSAAA